MKAITPSSIEGLLPPALEFLQRLVETNSYTLNREGLARNAELIAAQFAPLGFTAEHVPSENPAFGSHLFLRKAGTGASAPGLALVTHLDTVYPADEEERSDFHWRVEGDRIYGPGVLDIKGGTVMIWLVLSALQAAAPEIFARTHWLIAANAAEEELVPDFADRCRERLPAACRAALVFESCSGLGPGYSLVRSRKGSANVRLSVEGRGAHAGSRHHEGANAILELSRLIPRVAALTNYEAGVTANVGWITGGGPINRVPHAAACEVNIRAFDEPALQGALDGISALRDDPAVTRAASDGFPCRLDIQLISKNPPWPPNAGTDRLIDVWTQAAVALKIPLTSEPRGGLSDGNYLSRHLPVLDGLGPFGRNGHASQRSADGSKVPEYVEPASFVSMGAVDAAAILALLEE